MERSGSKRSYCSTRETPSPPVCEQKRQCSTPSLADFNTSTHSSEIDFSPARSTSISNCSEGSKTEREGDDFDLFSLKVPVRKITSACNVNGGGHKLHQTHQFSNSNKPATKFGIPQATVMEWKSALCSPSIPLERKANSFMLPIARISSSPSLVGSSCDTKRRSFTPEQKQIDDEQEYDAVEPNEKLSSSTLVAASPKTSAISITPVPSTQTVCAEPLPSNEQLPVIRDEEEEVQMSMPVLEENTESVEETPVACRPTKVSEFAIPSRTSPSFDEKSDCDRLLAGASAAGMTSTALSASFTAADGRRRLPTPIPKLQPSLCLQGNLLAERRLSTKEVVESLVSQGLLADMNRAVRHTQLLYDTPEHMRMRRLRQAAFDLPPLLPEAAECDEVELTPVSKRASNSTLAAATQRAYNPTINTMNDVKAAYNKGVRRNKLGDAKCIEERSGAARRLCRVEDRSRLPGSKVARRSQRNSEEHLVVDDFKRGDEQSSKKTKKQGKQMRLRTPLTSVRLNEGNKLATRTPTLSNYDVVFGGRPLTGYRRPPSELKQTNQRPPTEMRIANQRPPSEMRVTNQRAPSVSLGHARGGATRRNKADILVLDDSINKKKLH